MSVLTQVELPAQPTVGGVVFHPLGGNGFSGPHSVYHGLVESASDASGGKNEIQVRLDPRFTQLVIQVQCSVAGQAAALDCDIQLFESVNSVMGVRREVPYRPISGLTAAGHVNWNPAPFLLSAGPKVGSNFQPYLRTAIDNTNGETLYCRFHVYNFDKRARELVPIEIMSSVLVRAESVT